MLETVGDLSPEQAGTINEKGEVFAVGISKFIYNDYIIFPRCAHVWMQRHKR